MNKENGLVILLVLLQFCFFWFCLASDTITIGKPIHDGELVISKAQKFALGFFSPGSSHKRYLGIWFNNLPIKTVVWVANRDDPINDTSGVLSINPNGNNNLELNHKRSNIPIWSTNVSVTISPNTTLVAQLSDIGNLVLTQNDSKTVIWQSFDHPTDTQLPYAKVGVNKRTGQSLFLQSWKTSDDPGSGSFVGRYNTSGKAQLILYNNNLPWWREGSFNGEIFVGTPYMKQSTVMNTLSASVVDDDNEVSFSYYAYNQSTISRVVLDESGQMQILVWDHQMNQWNRYWSAPTVQCDIYGTCGSNSKCDPLSYENFQCSCLPGFEPKNPDNWYQNKDASEGCVRKNDGQYSICGSGEGFVKVESVKIPDTSVAKANMGLNLEECEQECLRDCSCTAYAVADVRNGGSGCLAWYGTLMDTQVLSDQGQDLYVRVDATELGLSYISLYIYIVDILKIS